MYITFVKLPLELLTSPFWGALMPPVVYMKNKISNMILLVENIKIRPKEKNNSNCIDKET